MMKSFLLLSSLLLNSFFYLSSAHLLTRYFLNTVSPNAICNDGSPAAYYFSPGFGDGATKWVIRLQGGGWCWDENSCKTRQTYYITTNGTQSTANYEGILSNVSSENPFYNYNHATLYYCTSDSHLGTKYANESLNGWNFLGKEVVKAYLHHLLYSQQPPLTSATHILLTGDSAGAVSTVNNVDFIADIITPVIPKVHYRAFVDAGLFLDLPSFNIPDFSFQLIAKNLVNYWGAIYDESCVDAYGAGNEWHCFHTQYSWPYIKTLSFYQEYQFDKANLDMDGVTYPFSQSGQDYTEAFQKDMISNVTKFPYLFLPNCYKHETIDSGLFYETKIGNVSLAQAVWNWFNDYSTVPAISRTLDECGPINCNPTCPPMP